MNIFSGTGLQATSAIGMFLKNVKAGSEDVLGSISERGPPQNENAATVGGGRFSRETDTGHNTEVSSIKEQLEGSSEKLNSMDVVGSAVVPTSFGNKRAVSEWAIQLLKVTGYKVDRQGYGTIIFDAKSIRYGLDYANTDAEKAAFAVLPQVLKRGIEIGQHTNHKQRGKETITFAAPVVLNGVRGNMAVVVNRNGNHYYTHRILMPNGTMFELKGIGKDIVQKPSRGVTVSGSLADTISTMSENSIPNPDRKVNGKDSQTSLENVGKNDRKSKYSLEVVPPVQPSSESWSRGATFDEVKEEHPTLFALDTDESEKRNPTQIKGTVSTYRKLYERLKTEGFHGTILDASSGLGYGTKAGREEYGFSVDDIEPFPDAKYKPMYTDYSALHKTYDVVISNAVLNVIPQDLRDAMVVKIGELLASGGRAFINVRGADVKSAGSKVAINENQMEYFVSNTGSYQKDFRQSELVAYLKDALGDEYTVEPTSEFGAVSAVVTKDERYSRELATVEDLRRENEELRGRLDYWKQQVKTTKQPTVRQDDIATLARRLKKSFDTTLGVDEIGVALTQTAEYMMRKNLNEGLSWEELRGRLDDVSRKIAEGGKAQLMTDDSVNKEVRDWI